MAQSAYQTLPEFALARKRLTQQSGIERQQAEDALKRYYARLGGLSSGSYIKQIQEAQQTASERSQQGTEMLDIAELQELQRRKEIEEQRTFASTEAEKQRGFLKEEAGIGRKFSAEESLLGREFAKGESLLGREFASREAKIGRDFAGSESAMQRAFQEKVFASEEASKIKQMDLAERQFTLDQQIAEFNKQIALHEQNKPTDLMASLFGPQFGTSNIPINIHKPLQSAGSIQSVWSTGGLSSIF